MINNTAVENKHPTEANIDTVYPITFSGATDSGGLPMFKVTLTYADGSSKELKYNVDYKLVYDDVQENNNESFNKPHLNGIKFLLPEYAVAGNTVYILRTTPFEQPVDFQIGRIDPEQIEKIADSSVLRDQEIRNQANKDRATIQECQRNISSNAEAIQKARDDFSAEDAKINKRIDDHAEELDAIREDQTTANANIESNSKAIQTTRDDFTAADSVLRKDIDNNKSDIAKLRDDMNTSDAALQGQITAQAAKIATKQNKLTAGDNIIISGDVISATGAGGGAGLSFVVYDTLPETGKSGIVYLVPKGSEAPDVYDEYIWITATQTFELIGSTQVDLTDYAKKEYVDNAIAEFESFPDQTGNAGKFLQTDGTTVSWGEPIQTTAQSVGAGTGAVISNQSVAVGFQAKNSGWGVAIGYTARNTGTSSVAIGRAAEAAKRAIAIGYGARVTAENAILLNASSNEKTENNDPNTFKVANKNGIFEIMSADGTMPADRMSATAGTTGQVLTKTDTGMAWQEPAGGTKVIFREWEE